MGQAISQQGASREPAITQLDDEWEKKLYVTCPVRQEQVPLKAC